ncbi:MAG: SUMF1/EgtB/PvdO family nonheme iron enzyme [Rubripirellula sp.]
MHVLLEEIAIRFLALLTLLFSVALVSHAHAGIVTFGSGSNSFNIEFVAIGDAGNAADTGSGFEDVGISPGAVPYEYQIGKYEISREMIEAYNTIYGQANSQVITVQTRDGEMSYAAQFIDEAWARAEAAGGISWNEAARFVNWLNTSQGHSAAYKFESDGVNDDISVWSETDAGYDSNNPFRNSNAIYVLPTLDEWHKAAYFDPATDSWRAYATLDGTAPSQVPFSDEDRTGSGLAHYYWGGTEDNTAAVDLQPYPAMTPITLAGGLNAFGVMGMAGNVYEQIESPATWFHDPDEGIWGAMLRVGSRGGSYKDSRSSASTYSAYGSESDTTFEYEAYGLRIVNLATSSSNVPEPSTALAMGLLGVVGFAGNRRRRRQS